ncbi:MAG TPA: FtsH protease activity modulator HflK [Chthoniobacterales bacterium]|jgi:membrane protease subunit HflK
MATLRDYDPFGKQPGQINLGWVWKGALALFVLITIFSGFATVPADSVGILLRLGKYQQSIQPGLRFKLPFGIDRLIIVPVQRQLKLEFGFQTPGATNPDQPSVDPTAEKTMVTGDLNMALVEWVVQYRIAEPEKYLFEVRSPAATIRDASESIMREVVGDRLVDEVLTVGRQDIENETLLRLQNLTKSYGLGVTVMQVQLKDVHPPQSVQSSFNEVNQAQQEREQMINVANGEYNKAVPRARGQADQRLRGAEGYALGRVNEARGDTEKFNALLAEYIKAPAVMRQRLYLEAMATILPKIERKVIVDPGSAQLLPILSLDSQLPKPAPKAPTE